MMSRRLIGPTPPPVPPSPGALAARVQGAGGRQGGRCARGPAGLGGGAPRGGPRAPGLGAAVSGRRGAQGAIRWIRAATRQSDGRAWGAVVRSRPLRLHGTPALVKCYLLPCCLTAVRRRQLAELAAFQGEKAGLESELQALRQDNEQLRQQLVQQRQTMERWALAAVGGWHAQPAGALPHRRPTGVQQQAVVPACSASGDLCATIPRPRCFTHAGSRRRHRPGKSGRLSSGWRSSSVRRWAGGEVWRFQPGG
jgi:hypothetical protein